MDMHALPVARLVYGDVTLRLYPGQALKIGRAADNDLIVDDPKVSRGHARLEWNGAGFSLRDLGSVNGTFVNGERLGDAPRLLRDGDELAVHTHKLRYTIERAEPVALPQEMGRFVAPALAGARLVVTAGPDAGKEFPIWGEQVTVGRAAPNTRLRSAPTAQMAAWGSPGSPEVLPITGPYREMATWEIRLSDPAVSRPHARIERRAGRYYLLDLGSANGTSLNGQPITAEAPLTDGDCIVTGATELRFHAPPPTEPPSPQK